jgi:hypothetical protein
LVARRDGATHVRWASCPPCLRMTEQLASTRILLEPQHGRGYRLRCRPTTLGGSRGGDRRHEHGFARIATHDTPLPRKAACLPKTPSLDPRVHVSCAARRLARDTFSGPLKRPATLRQPGSRSAPSPDPRSDEGRLGVPGRPSQPSK